MMWLDLAGWGRVISVCNGFIETPAYQPPIDDISITVRVDYTAFSMDEKESFCHFCQLVQLEDKLKENAWSVWESIATRVREKIQCDLIPWFVCAVYITICNERSIGLHSVTDHRVISLSDLLKAAKMRLVEFFQRMKELMEVCEVGIHATESLTELKKTFCISAALFYKFNRIMPSVLQDHQTLEESDTRDMFCKQMLLLFIICKGWQVERVTDLMTAFYLLLCCIDYIHRKFVLLRQQPSGFTEVNMSVKQGILSDLCKESNVPYTKVHLVFMEYFQPFIKSFPEDNTEDMLSVENLTHMYEDIYRRIGGVDERDFFNKDGYLWIQFNELESKGQLNGNGCTALGISQCVTVATASSTTTTVTETETRDSCQLFTELRTSLDQVSDTPSQELARFWSCCHRNPQNIIQSNLTVVHDLFVEGFAEAVGADNSSTSQQIFAQAKKLYFRVMEAMLLAEEKRLLCSDFSALLNSQAFHTSLLACSLEVLMAENRLPWQALEFPWILKVVKLKAFDFFKVTESFILHEPLLGNNLIKHLNRIEEQILESLAWTTDSPVYAALACLHQRSDPKSMSPENQPKKSQPLNLFLRKVYQLAYLRLTSLCNELDIDEILRGHMWTCLEQSLRIHWHLMKDRHLDQLLLCAVYAISKVVGKEIQFKQIVASYKSLSFASVHVYRGSPVAGRDADSIILFYNKLYMVTMKSIILQFAPNKNPPVSPAPKSALRIRGKTNVYLSPLKGSPSEMLTPKSRSLYSFGESPGSGDRESLSRINASMRAAVHSQVRPQKRLRFEECENSSPDFTNGNSTEKGTN